LKWDRAQAEAQRLSDDVAGNLKKATDFDTVAKPRGLSVGESSLFSREEPITGLGMAPAAVERAFELKDGEISEAVRTPQGFAFLMVTGRQDAYVPKLEEVKARVREDVVKKKALDLARQRAAAVAAQMKSGDFTAAAKAAGVEVKTTDFIARGAPIADVGASPAVDAAAFALPPGAVSEPIVTDAGAVVVKVLEKQNPAETELAAARDTLKTELLNERRNRFYGAYMTKARERMNVTVNRELIAQLVA
jgi:parvulin-like peptidyl-prolyl isomerase